jgi:DNA modification methylase
MDESPSTVTEAAEELAVTTTAPELEPAVIATPAPWFTGLSPEAKQKVRWVKVAALKEHTACDFLPFLPRSFDAVRHSVAEHGVLFPLAVAADGRVLDGRYRLRAAQALGLPSLPVLSIDVQGEDAVRWVFQMKQNREHLSEAERAVMAVQYQARLSGQYKKVRATKMTAARSAKATATRHSAKPNQKLDSRKEACQKFDVPLRKFNALKKLSKERPDLYEQIIRGQMNPDAAIKKNGKNTDAARVTAALAAAVRCEDIKDGHMENKIHQGEAQDMMKKIADDCASLVLFSPAYFGADVEYDPPLPQTTYQQYLDQLRIVLNESFRVSRSGGRLAVVVDTTKNPIAGGDEMLPIGADLTAIARSIGWRYWTDIAWIKPEVSGSKTTFGSLGQCSAPGWGRDHEWILLFFKDQKKLEGDQSLCDLSRHEHLTWWRTTWDVRPETRRNILAAHPAPYPETLAERLIKLLTYRRDLVIDAYNGSGTTTAVAKRLGRRYIGIDRSPNYCTFARQRAADTPAPDEIMAQVGAAEGTCPVAA